MHSFEIKKLLNAFNMTPDQTSTGLTIIATVTQSCNYKAYLVMHLLSQYTNILARFHGSNGMSVSFLHFLRGLSIKYLLTFEGKKMKQLQAVFLF